ncbi:hypothetical protein HMPREF0083_00372 [Aneurinibacillus aneurinilyticus ATCC 12856]|uniref:Uncharacterized protein n=1 Tax=Aneurinibacillus aneurinilyticus ATCC 12856 TaxID=649747 RepID=U1X976_ANEAE|nr:hypothetical protein HMPREF0083_00372 [Aneurinibacillus aneurinilyticus ATCC 12856]
MFIKGVQPIAIKLKIFDTPKTKKHYPIHKVIAKNVGSILHENCN